MWCAIPMSCGRILASSLAISGLDAGYGAVRVLHDVSLTVGVGETVALLGTNGNGKSTLLKCVMGIVGASAGSIVADMDGTRHELIGRSTEAIVELGIGFVPEGRRLFPKLSVDREPAAGRIPPQGAGCDRAQPGILLRDVSAAQGAQPATGGQHERR